MNELLPAAASALWLGLLTSASPCPLATNIAAVSFIGKQVGDSRRALLSGAFYTLGRIVAYSAIGSLLVFGLIATPWLGHWLERNMNILLGPLLIVVGVVLLGLLNFSLPSIPGSDRLKLIAEKHHYWGAGLLGLVFALSFCPVSAALFFGSLIPLSVKYQSAFVMPALYGLGTGLPVILFSFVIAFSAHKLGQAFNRIALVEKWSRRITGVIFILVGTYYALIYIGGVPI
jgi:cytochrome c-type biogenesis protein